MGGSLKKYSGTILPLFAFLTIGVGGELMSQERSSRRADGKINRRAIQGPGDRVPVSREGLDLSVVTSIAYDDNIFQNAEDEISSIVVQLEPSISWTVGKKDETWVSIAYEGSAVAYLSQSDDNRIDHRIEVEGAVKRDKVSLAYTARWARLGNPSADIGGTSDRNEWDGRIAAIYRPKGKLSYEIFAEFSADDQIDPAFFDFFESSAGIAARYHYSPKTEVEVAYRLGQVDVDGSGEQTFHQFGGEFFWQPRSKLTISLEGGLEYRDYVSGSGLDPYLSARITWNPRKKTSFFFEAYRREDASATFEGENIDVTGFRLGASQVLRGGWTAGVEVGRETLDYFGVTGLPETGREDTIIFFRPTLRYSISEDAALTFLYQWSQNDSNDPAFGFDNNQFGVSVNYRF